MRNSQEFPAQAAVYSPGETGLLEADLVQDIDVRLAWLQHEAAARADRLIRSVGALAVAHETALEPRMSLHVAAQQAHETHDVEAISLIENNVRTDFMERMFKAGHVMKVTLQRNETGQFVQNRQTAEDIQVNTLRYANANNRIKSRTHAETANMYYLESLSDEGLLKDNYAVVVSLCPDMDDDTLDELGFFSFSKSLVIQATTEESAAITTESAFIAGSAYQGAKRTDRAVAVSFGEQFGEDWQGLNDSQIIQRVLLIPKAQMPNGVIDLVEKWDDIAGGTFFGQAKPREDYQAYLVQCRERERNFEPIVQQITQRFIAKAPDIHTPREATQVLNALSGAHALEHALTDATIDARVFGAQAATSLAEARFHYERGNMAQVHLAMSGAHKTNASGSCPSGTANQLAEVSLYNEDGSMKSPEQLALERIEAATNIEEEDKYGSLHFTCQRGHPNKRPRGKLIPKCKECGIAVGCGPAKLSNKPLSKKAAELGAIVQPAFWDKAPLKQSHARRSDYGLAS